MKFQQLLDELQALAKSRPETLEYEAVFSIDEEGNSFHPVAWTATVGQYLDSEFKQESETEDEEAFTPDAVCIN